MEKNWCKITVKKDIFFEAAKKTEEEGRSKAEN